MPVRRSRSSKSDDNNVEDVDDPSARGDSEEMAWGVAAADILVVVDVGNDFDNDDDDVGLINRAKDCRWHQVETTTANDVTRKIRR